MRALAVNQDVIVVVSAIWQTTATFVRSGEEGFLIDSPIMPEELDALPSLSEQAGFPVSGLLCTHADWDHLLGRLAFPEASLGVGEPSAERLRAEPGAAQRKLRSFDEEHYVEGRPPLRLAALQSLPVPGRLSIGDAAEIELHPASGHTADGTAFWMPWTRVLVCGDYLSAVEIPMISMGGSADEYLATLRRLTPLVEAAEMVVPGHGTPLGPEQAGRILAEDLDYVTAVARGEDPPLPADRRTTHQKEIHADNLSRLGVQK